MNNKKPCTSCKHARNYGEYLPMLCNSHRIPLQGVIRIADIQRQDNWFMARFLGTCGKSGRFFERNHD